MGERADEVDGTERLDVTSQEESQSPDTPEADADLTNARAEIEETRTEMSETIDAIQEKLSPEHVKEQAKESIRQATVGQVTEFLQATRRRGADTAGAMPGLAKTTGSKAASTAQQKPILLAGAGSGVVGLVIAARMVRARQQRPSPTPAPTPPDSGTVLDRVQRALKQGMIEANRIAAQRTGRVPDKPIVPTRTRFMGRALGTNRSQSAPASASEGGNRIMKKLVLTAVLAVPATTLIAKKIRQSAGKEEAMTRNDLVLAWLNNAYSTENGLVQTLQSHAKDAKDFPQLQARIQQHVEETRRHANLIQGCIQRLGGNTSGLKSGMGTLVGKAQGVVARPAQDAVVKNALADSAAEQLEIASYKALGAAAQDLGDQETLSICRQILEEEEDMARFLDQNLPTVVVQTMNIWPVAAS